MPAFLDQALALARQGLTLTSPNPAVGCVIASPEGWVIGQGHTQIVGGPHAEVMALRAAREAGHDVRGGTAYVTLEPCSHFGRTPPCCNALIEAGIAKVVVARQDPNPLVAGQGVARLRAAGLEVSLLDPDDPAAIATRELNIGFFSRMIRKSPWVRMKMAASLDGTTALANGQSQWITGPEARADGHAWRARASAVLTGIGTVLQDDPRLDVRLVETPRQPCRIIVDSRLQTPPGAAMFKTGAPVWLYSAIRDEAREAALTALGATVTCLPDGQGQVDLSAMLQDLGRREINELHVEAGSRLNGALIGAGLVDEFLIYLAPKLLGPGRGMASFGPLQSLSDALELQFQSTEQVGPDLRILARVAGRGTF
ncbi:MAG: bifunctional diaminohydroxyphosphoribosylaminopyrimidine deaminase/5-amino-6-(5-phosphoribosylamino)uracil reductase RibD [Pseudomonadota bacterium]|nr:bifunctional diaminohydroxyphosphoribosylaminopyrimidine deaminase/5-amino-6-(5-phosphoribosylamino)uracil reductase RibD [Pseudomonadota bacterium]